MCERRVLILAVVTDIHDTTVTYPSCDLCYSKLLVDPTTDRFHCIKCAVSCDRRRVQWRYRLVLSVADGTTLGRIVVFGKTLDGFFGKTATDFSRSLSDLERTGYPASSMLAEALLNTFHGKYFYFGFKLTGSSDDEDKLSLKDVIKSENSLCYSQLDCTSNFENFHTLAYQMLACSDGVFASVTDHMRLFVKHLRSHNQSKPLKTPEQNQSMKNQENNQSNKNVSIRTLGSSNSYRTVSFGADLDSLRFSFETSGNQSSSLQEPESYSRNRSSVSINKSFDTVENDGSFSAPLIDLKDKEIFLAGETIVYDLPRCVTFDTVNDNGDSCFPSVGNWNKSYSAVLSKFTCTTQNGSCAPSVSNINPFTFYSDISVAQKLNFYDLNKSDASNTSKKIDEELQRRQIVTWQKNTDNKSAYTSNAAGERNWINQNKNEPDLKMEITKTEYVDLPDITFETDMSNERHLNNNESFDNATEINVDVSKARLQKDRLIEELKMPESEDLNAFFDSQFEGIELTQDVVIEDNDISAEIDDGEANLFVKNGDIENDNNLCKKKDKPFSIINNSEKVNSKTENSENISSKTGANKANSYLEKFKDFLDSFEDCIVKDELEKCMVNEEEVVRQSNVEMTAGEAYTSLKEVPTMDNWNETDQALDGLEDLNKDRDTRFESFKQNIGMKNKEEFVEGNVSHEINDEIYDDFLHEMEESSTTIENGLNDDEQAGIDNDKLIFNDLLNYDKVVNIQKVSSTLFVDKKSSRMSDLDKEADREETKENKFVEKDKPGGKISDDYYQDSNCDSDDLDCFFADISNERNYDKVENEEIRAENSSSRQKSDANNVMDVEKKDEKTAEEMESNFVELFDDLSLMEFKSNYVEKSKQERNGNVESVTNHKEGSHRPKKSMKTDDLVQDKPNNDFHDDDINNSVIDKSSDFEERKFKIDMFKPCKLKPISNFFRADNKSVKASETYQEARSHSSDLESVDLKVVNRSTPGERVIEQSVNGSEIDRFQEAKKINNLQIEFTIDKDTKNESSCINYSADLFEMSDGCNEQNSLNVLTVSTPSFSTKSSSENASLNEDLFEDSPIGTSTPGLDECVILESQDMSCVCDSQSEIDLEDQLPGKRKVKFDKRLRRVSTCHVMDIRMRLNESPLTIPVSAGKSCLKSKKMSLKNVPEISLKQELLDKCENAKLDFVNRKVNEDSLGVYIETDSVFKQNSECLDGSSDLFGGSFIASARSPLDLNYNVACHSYKSGTVDKETGSLKPDSGLSDKLQHMDVKNCKTMWLQPGDRESDGLQHEDVKNAKIVGLQHVNEKNVKDNNGHMAECFSNSQDLWLNESTDSFIYDAQLNDNNHELHEKPDEKSMKLDTRKVLHDRQENEKNIDLQKRNTAQAVTPDLFSSQCNNINFSTKENTKVSNLHCVRFNGKKINDKDRIEKCTKRMALKCLVINTPDCDSGNVSKHKPVLLKFENPVKENVGISPDIFGDSIEEGDVELACDRKTTVFDENNVLCKKLFF
ncbi:uncharacterized protein LOC132714819 [Ruditapes philippinarum]|uniref:uncharacterized protein LOC132714819 n=1 Tax=Ruditapes philippinarum TaxID=129788 RepID=UPI00295C29DE|nr:uncharacterized protein LOC132714819 [Ruditapes philippinarum]